LRTLPCIGPRGIRTSFPICKFRHPHIICTFAKEAVNRSQAYIQLFAYVALTEAGGGQGGYFIGQLPAVGRGAA
jgi:hypothetical protein